VICPACSARCLVDDGFCHYCHRPLPTGPRRASFVQWGGAIGTIAATALVVAAVHITSAAAIAAALCLSIPFAFAGACLGSLAGWLIGWAVCDH
jgi:hypothetical protein